MNRVMRRLIVIVENDEYWLGCEDQGVFSFTDEAFAWPSNWPGVTIHCSSTRSKYAFAPILSRANKHLDPERIALVSCAIIKSCNSKHFDARRQFTSPGVGWTPDFTTSLLCEYARPRQLSPFLALSRVSHATVPDSFS